MEPLHPKNAIKVTTHPNVIMKMADTPIVVFPWKSR